MVEETKAKAKNAFFEAASLPAKDVETSKLGVLALQDGSVFQGFSFGAEKSVSGECVFQTGNFD